MTLQPVVNKSAWRADQCSREDFVFDLQANHLDAFANALAAVDKRRISTEAITRDDFPLNAIQGDIEKWVSEVQIGSGIIILRGFPMQSYTQKDIERIYFGLGTYFGRPMSQSNMGDRLGHIINVGGKDPRERAYRNSMELDMHTDSCDIVAILCIRPAQQGGVSGYVSAISIYNEMLSRRPDLVPLLMRGFRYHRFGEQAPGEAPVTEEPVPVFSFKDGYLSVNYLRSYIEMGAEELGTPLTDDEVSALDLMDEIASDEALALRFVAQTGEAVFFNNFTVLHNRTAFEDAADPALRRHLLRLWLVAHQPRPVDDTLRTYEGHGIEKQAGRSTYFDGDMDLTRIRKRDKRM